MKQNWSRERTQRGQAATNDDSRKRTPKAQTQLPFFARLAFVRGKNIRQNE
jgi:hypothetical protein